MVKKSGETSAKGSYEGKRAAKMRLHHEFSVTLLSEDGPGKVVVVAKRLTEAARLAQMADKMKGDDNTKVVVVRQTVFTLDEITTIANRAEKTEESDEE